MWENKFFWAMGAASFESSEKIKIKKLKKTKKTIIIDCDGS